MTAVTPDPETLEAAVEAAAQTLVARLKWQGWSALPETERTFYRSIARKAINAAAPFLTDQPRREGAAQALRDARENLAEQIRRIEEGR